LLQTATESVWGFFGLCAYISWVSIYRENCELFAGIQAHYQCLTNRLSICGSLLVSPIGSGTGLGTLCERVMTALPNKRYSGHHKAADLEDDLGTPGREI